jgi:hypothetical protein
MLKNFDLKQALATLAVSPSRGSLGAPAFQPARRRRGSMLVTPYLAMLRMYRIASVRIDPGSDFHRKSSWTVARVRRDRNARPFFPAGRHQAIGVQPPEVHQWNLLTLIASMAPTV